MFYAIRHLTRFRYSDPVQENVMEARMQPRNEEYQTCVNFHLNVTPAAQIQHYQDYLGNIVHHFDLPRLHKQLSLTAEALVKVIHTPQVPDSLPASSWQALAQLGDQFEFWDMLRPSRFTQPTPLLNSLAQEFNIDTPDPLTAVRQLNERIFAAFAYAPQTTDVHSTFDKALAQRKGVCQDFTHIMIALLRQIGVPTRYVSGYLFHRQQTHDHSIDRSVEDASHAWVEAYLPELGWVGFDPTNNLIVGERHIRVAVGRDYADVPPTRGVYSGEAKDELSVGVSVTIADDPAIPDEELLPETTWEPLDEEDLLLYQQQQQQQ